jgi:hypothetical protein
VTIHVHYYLEKFFACRVETKMNVSLAHSVLPAAHRSDVLDQDEEIKTLIRIFSKGDVDDKNRHFKPVQMQKKSNVFQRSTNPELLDPLPPPSKFIRQRKSSYTVPPGPLSVQSDVESTFKDSSSAIEPLDEYDIALNFLLSPTVE